MNMLTNKKDHSEDVVFGHMIQLFDVRCLGYGGTDETLSNQAHSLTNTTFSFRSTL